MTPKILLQTTLAIAIAAPAVPCRAASLPVDPSGLHFSKDVSTWKEMRSRYVVPQSLDYSCGPAALATLLNYYFNDNVTEKQIINWMVMTGNLARIKARRGFSLLDLKKFCVYRGYQVTGYRGDLEFFVKLGTPVLVPVNIKEYSHFVILRGVKEDRVFIADPALGKITVRVDKFRSMWKGGVGLVLSKPGGDTFSASPLALTENEQVVTTDPDSLKSVIGSDLISNLYTHGEF